MSNKAISIFTFILLLSTLLVTGCGQPKVSGKVVFSDDQSPVTHGVVIFHGDNHIARGYIADGKYVMESLKKNDGLPPGKYRIAIKETQVNIGPDALPVYKNLIDKKYESPDTSGLSLNVTKSQTFDIQVDRFVEDQKSR